MWYGITGKQTEISGYHETLRYPLVLAANDLPLKPAHNNILEERYGGERWGLREGGG
jgi:hypothetical protein